jgi:hypothetical protein
MKQFAWSLVVVVMLSIGGLAVPGLKSPVRIGMNPSSWRGRCPAEFRFTATIVSRGAGTVYYHWERSDGSSTPRQSTSFSGANQERTMGNEWRVSRPVGERFRGWEQFVATEPNFIRSNRAIINMTCTK